MEMQVLRILQRIKGECPRRCKDLKASLDTLIAALSSREAAGGKGSEDSSSDADAYFAPIKDACDSKQHRVMEVALEGLHQLIEHGYLRGNKQISRAPTAAAAANPVESGEENASASIAPKRLTLMDLVVETVSRCAEEFNDGVHLQVIKVLLTTVTSSYCEVHENSLLLAVRACFHIHLISKNQANKTSAKAALTQMLSVVNVRMEIFDARARAETEAALSALQTTLADAIPLPQMEEEEEVEEGRSRGDHEIVETESSEAAAAAAAAATTRAGGGTDGKDDEPEQAPSKEDEQVSEDMKTVQELNEREKQAFTTLQGEGPAASADSSSASISFPSIMHKDSFLLFRALCSMSTKGLQDEGGGTDALTLQNKLLSLELILHILQRSGPAFRSGESFIHVIRNSLCFSLLHNCTSPNAQVTGLSLQIFVALMEGFKDHLKSELEVFVTNIFLRILESENSTYDHKLRVLEVFLSICRDPNALVELFINYDCDLDAIDLFRRIVDGFAKVAKNPSVPQSRNTVDFMSSAGKRAQVEEQSLRIMGLNGIVVILRSLLRSAGLGVGVAEESSDAASASSGAANTVGGISFRSNVVAKDALAVNSPTKSEAAADEEAMNSSTSGATSSFVGGGVGPSTAASEGEGAKIVDVFDRKQKIQEEIETGILKFNLSSKKGLAYLASLGHVELTPKSVANFLHQYEDRLDKTTVGDYLGREREYENGFCLKVLHEYVDAMNFARMPFDMAIRHFLAGFRLPGEAQKIDRLMEKFAERYYLQNRDTFASADMAFILAFSTIMLQTNLHNPAIRDDKRMTKEQFVKQNKDISADGELSDSMLMEIYDRIAAQPISMTQDEKLSKKLKKDDQSTILVFQSSVDKRRKDAFNDERKEMVRAGRAMFQQKREAGKVFVRVGEMSTDDAYVRPMFEVAWAPIMGVLSQILETYDDQAMVELCLAGFQYAIRLACRLDFPVGRSTYINALATFTALDAVREMKPKNVESSKVLINIALSEGDYLEESWSQVLQCISQLARLQLFANGLHTDEVFFSDASDSGRNKKGSVRSSFGRAPGDPFSKLFGGQSRAETTRQVEEANAEMVVREINTVLIDRIFLNSHMLSGESVQHFVRSLCEVSLLEISSSRSSLRSVESSGDSATPRVFSLQKLVEVADFNMHSRSRIAWTNIWSLLAHHFTTVGMYDNHPLAMYAIDSLKQLSIKFLQKEELSNFNFQRVFLKPFEVIISRSKSQQIKDLILRCIDIMILACASNIRSGWRSIFSIFEASANQEALEIATIGFEITERLMLNQFDLLIFDFVELMNCLVAFVASVHTTLSLRALNLLETCAHRLAEGAVAPALNEQLAPPAAAATGAGSEAASDSFAQSLSSSPSNTPIGEDARVFRIWWPLLLGLSTRVADYRLQVRIRALETLHLILRSYGHLFSCHAWAVIFRGVLFPMVDSAKTDNTRQPVSSWPTENPPSILDRQSWIGTMGLSVLSACVDLYQLFGQDNEMTTSLLAEMIVMLEGCICQDTESLAKIGLRTLNDLVLSLGVTNASEEEAPVNGSKERGDKLDATIADLTFKRLCACFENNLCLDFGPAGSLRFSRETPIEVSNRLTLCPLVSRRYAKNGKSALAAPSTPAKTPQSRHHEDVEGEAARVISTPFGEGSILRTEEPHASLSFPARTVITLPWGILYTTESFPETEVTVAASPKTLQLQQVSSRESETSPPLLSEHQAWEQFSASAMTSMVVSIDFIRVLGEAFETHFESLNTTHFAIMLSALEASHWHARSFNEDQRLRTALRERIFMRFHDNPNRLPNLLEQEVRSVTQLVMLVAKLFANSETEALAAPFVKRYTEIVCSRYMDLDDTLSSPTPVSVDLVAAYRPAVLVSLEGLCNASPEQFLSLADWLCPLLTRLVLSNSREVRSLVSKLFDRHILPIVVRTKR